MALNTGNDSDFDYKFSRSWTINGHEVALGRLKYLKRKNDPWSQGYLFCACDFDFKIETDTKGNRYKIQKKDPHKCRAKAKARQMVMAESRTKHGKAWKKMGLKEALLDIHRRVKKKEWMGQRDPGLIYAQEAAKVLNADLKEVWQACGELYAEERLALNGAIFEDFEKRFRLPQEMAGVIFHVVGDPLGYPNGDAGDGAIYGCEMRIQKLLDVTSGRKAFGDANWPNIDGEIVAVHVLEPLSGMLAAASALPNARKQLQRCSRKAFMKDLAPLAESHSEIRIDVMAEYMRELVRLAFERIPLNEAMLIEKPSDVQKYTLREMSEELLGWAEALRKLPTR